MARLGIRNGVIAGAVLLGLAGAAGAQPPGLQPGGVGAPAFSPYLNLLRNNSPTYLNYYGLVRPQMNFQQSIQGLQQGLGATQYQTQQLQSTEATLAGTGHPSYFMNSSRYFMTNGAGIGLNRGGVRPGGGQIGGMRPPGGAVGGGAAPATTPPRR